MGLLLVATVAPVFAHHSFSAEFDRNKQVRLKGVVTKIAWQNPHVWFFMNVKDEKTGKTVNYGFELGPPHLLQAGRLTKETIKIGTELTVEGSLAKNGSNNVNASSVVTKDGVRLSGQSSQTLTP
jgi:hypothetical protein